ncbi:hypothetical protein PQD09_gp26 [Providencia phage PSTCR4]|uniref:Head-tail joining protein n=2 Tax=Craquatrovirus TaxID=3044694 RepID=A0A7S9SUW6_9CAUD|nr:hypothetical protein PQD09_gp26 [Providencia phage PSTCR4]YP_010675311.1 hypothetical protein PQD10_gp72 [Providencia phage PSTCR7]QPB12047.1 hypothetical protein [Providencia phage PSTCR4]QPI18524.1 hypothetical protein [Providencia phage PSTCR7]
MNRQHAIALRMAKRNIDKEGTLFSISLKNAQGSVDPEKPWIVIPTTNEIKNLKGVFLTKRQRPINGSIVQRQDLTVLCIPTDPPLTNEAIQGAIITRHRDNYQFVVTELEVVSPGDIEILYKIKGIV